MHALKLARPVLFLSTLSLRRATQQHLPDSTHRRISIHALLAESDKRNQLQSGRNGHFYPRSPCGERRQANGCTTVPNFNFYPRSPCGERLPEKSESLTTYFISIHALLAESDSRPKALKSRRMVFLSTLSLRRATAVTTVVVGPSSDFYPRSPCGERQRANSFAHAPPHISIHALLAESDSQQPRGTTRTTYFYPRSPCGERRLWTILYSCPGNFYPRSPCGERPEAQSLAVTTVVISIHALLAESDTWTRGSRATYVISIHALLAESDYQKNQNL